MNKNTIIKTALNLRNKYNSNINKLLENYNINVINLKKTNLQSFTMNCNECNTIFYNKNDGDKNFILAHEIGHILFHDNIIRNFNKIDFQTPCEYEANLFATIFLNCEYRDCSSDDSIQKIINYELCNMNVSDFKLGEFL